VSLIISATNRPNSYTHRVANVYQARLTELGHPQTLLDLQDVPHDLLFSDLYGKRSEAFKPFEQQMLAAQKMLFVVPEYNGSFPGILKVFIDALPRAAFINKKAALVGVADGKFGNQRGLEHLTGILNYCQTHVLPYKAHYMKISQLFDADGTPTEALLTEVNNQLKRYLEF
jgi:chromate reductase, NAD(P)H dehydrogenase (quinone)